MSTGSSARCARSSSPGTAMRTLTRSRTRWTPARYGGGRRRSASPARSSPVRSTTRPSTCPTPPTAATSPPSSAPNQSPARASTTSGVTWRPADRRQPRPHSQTRHAQANGQLWHAARSPRAQHPVSPADDGTPPPQLWPHTFTPSRPTPRQTGRPTTALLHNSGTHTTRSPRAGQRPVDTAHTTPRRAVSRGRRNAPYPIFGTGTPAYTAGRLQSGLQSPRL